TMVTAPAAEQVLFAPAGQTQVGVRASVSDDSERDVTKLAVVEPTTLRVRVTPDGLVRRQNWGETSILVRFLDQRTAVRLAFVPARTAFRWQERPETNYIDQYVVAQLRTLLMQPAA